jgi:pyridoxal 5-phosphate dependent beta-lyase
MDHAAAGRTSVAVRHAVTAHEYREAQVGAYVAEGEAETLLNAGRADLAALLGVRSDGLAFFESASAAVRALLSAWRLHDGDAIGLVRSEWGPNRQAFTQRGLRIVELTTDDAGHLDLGALSRQLATDPPAVIHLTQLAAHRPLVQPVAEAAKICRAAGVPLWVDAAQALGQLDTAVGADAVYATGRKWLGGPRGVAVLGVAERAWGSLAAERPVRTPGELAMVRWLESGEAHIAGRVGLCVAVHEYLFDGPQAINARLDEVGALTRAALTNLSGWELVDGDQGGAIVALRARGEEDVDAARARVLDEANILTCAAQRWRAEEMTEPLLRISPHVDCTPTALGRLREALGG